MALPLTSDNIRRAPKVLLHDHIDGGLRASTVLELAGACGYSGLPTQDIDELSKFFVRGGEMRDIGAYLAPFEHTVAVLQSADALTRAAFECGEDLAADGVVYAEVRFAPELHIKRGLTFMDTAIDAVAQGLRKAEETCVGAGGFPIVLRLLICGIRTSSSEVCFTLRSKHKIFRQSRYSALMNGLIDSLLRCLQSSGDNCGRRGCSSKSKKAE
jgi:adenosine deaminase